MPAATSVITLAGGCFWCTEAVFLEVRGVLAVESGYANGHTATVFLNFGKKATKEELVDRLVNYTSKASELGLPHAPKHFIQYLTEDDRPQVKFDGPDQLVDELKRNVEETKRLTA